MVVAGALDRARDENDDPVFVLEGGAALELRPGLRARATKDFDTTYRHAVEEMVERLDGALRHGHGDFTATRTEPEPIAEGRRRAVRDQAGLPRPLVGAGAARCRRGGGCSGAGDRPGAGQAAGLAGSRPARRRALRLGPLPVSYFPRIKAH
jgi:hypothetical protein